MNKKAWKTTALILLLVLAITGSYYCILRQLIFPSFLLIGLSLAILLEIKNTINSVFRTVEQALKSVAVGDHALGLKQSSLPSSIKHPLQQILDHQIAITKSQNSQKVIYENIIESVDTGILILKEDQRGAISIFFSNVAFSNLLELPRFTKWHLLAPHLNTFSDFITPQGWQNRKDVITLSVSKEEKTYSFKTFLSTLYEERYLIINLDTLQSIIDKKEKEAWYNLMKVMSHEIMNTITPINALSNNLIFLIEEKKTQLGDDFDDINQSVKTINRRTKQLAEFVNTYRSLAELPTPKKELIKVNDLIQVCLKTLSSTIKENNINTQLNINPPHLQFMLDSQQMEQAIINLLTNSIYAVRGVDNPKISISAYQQKDKNYIEIMDNGIGIPSEIKRDIFIPFFTTREDGSGIGLSLTKSIIQAHGGHISVTSEESETRFLIVGI